MKRFCIAALLFGLAVSPAAATVALDIMVWAPGYPGSTEQAQPTMDAFGAALARRAKEPIPPYATYYRSLEEGRAAVEDAHLVLVPTALWAAFGEELGLQEATVKHYMTNILQKLHVRNRVEAALLARESGM